MKIELNDNEKSQVLPQQEMEDKIIYLGRITEVFPRKIDGSKSQTGLFDEARCIKIMVEDCLDGKDGYLFFADGPRKRLLEAYGLEYPTNLPGKLVLSVYDKDTEELCGLIPMPAVKIEY